MALTDWTLIHFGPVQMDGQTESGAYEPTVQSAQMGSKTKQSNLF